MDLVAFPLGLYTHTLTITYYPIMLSHSITHIGFQLCIYFLCRAIEYHLVHFQFPVPTPVSLVVSGEKNKVYT